MSESARNLDFTFSDTIAGRVSAFDSNTRVFCLVTADGRSFDVSLDGGPGAELLHNLGEPYQDATSHIDELLTPGAFVLAYGIFYPHSPTLRFEAKRLIFVGRDPEDFRFEEAGWWIRQIKEIAGFYRKAQFGDGPIDFGAYRTEIRLGGDKTASHVQETDTISRLVYGMASAFLLTGEEEYLEVAERGTEYLREHMRFVDTDENVVYWYHGLKVDGDVETKLFTSEFSDDYDAFPPTSRSTHWPGPYQTYRITGDPRIKADVDATIRLFDRFYLDPEEGGYFSHIDPILLSPHHASLGPQPVTQELELGR